MDTVLGVSMAPTAVRMVLVEGENADGVTVDEEGFAVNTADAPTVSAADQVVSAILGTQEGAAESGYQLRSTGVTWTDPVEAAALRDALAARKVENVMLVSSFLAAAALAQVVGNSVGYAQTGLLFVEPDTATLALVNTADGSITDVHRQPLTPGSDPIAELSAMASGAEALETRPDGLFIVGSGVDIAPIKPQLEAATSLTGECARGAGDGAGSGCGAGLGQCTVVLLVDRCAGLCARSRHRCDRPIRRRSWVFRRRRRRRVRRASPGLQCGCGRGRRCLHRTRGRARVSDRQLYRRHQRYSAGRRPQAAVLGGERGRGDFRGRCRGTGGRAGDQHAADGGRPARTGPQCGRPGEAGARRTRSPSSCRCPGSGSRSGRPGACSGARGSGPAPEAPAPEPAAPAPAPAAPAPEPAAPAPAPAAPALGTCSGCSGSRPDSNSDSHRSGARALGPRGISRRRRLAAPAADTPAAEVTPEVATAASGAATAASAAEATAASATDLVCRAAVSRPRQQTVTWTFARRSEERCH